MDENNASILHHVPLIPITLPLPDEDRLRAMINPDQPLHFIDPIVIKADGTLQTSGVRRAPPAAPARVHLTEDEMQVKLADLIVRLQNGHEKRKHDWRAALLPFANKPLLHHAE
jgi:hypothetical protein